jgi:hypothetical protein
MDSHRGPPGQWKKLITWLMHRGRIYGDRAESERQAEHSYIDPYSLVAERRESRHADAT